ncbi:MAG: hypothetical protein WAM75_11935 [Xanthobacteraceae bacterium]
MGALRQQIFLIRDDAKIEATGGRHAVPALTLGLWVRRRSLTSRRHVVTKYVLSLLLWPVIWLLLVYREVSIWRTADYAHAIIGRDKGMITLSELGSSRAMNFFSFEKWQRRKAMRLSKRKRSKLVEPWYRLGKS